MYGHKRPVINNVSERFLQIAPSVAKCLEPEAKFSDFEIEKNLGTGSFGNVVLAKHKKTKVQYAIKSIDKRTKINKDGQPYFKREVEIMYKIHHPNVVRLYGHFEDEDFCYFIMEYINKGSLFHLISDKRKRPLDEKTIALYMKDIISAVYYLHKMNPPIIHRDIKPENALLTEQNTVKLTDFGWSNYLVKDTNNQRSTFCGTPIYLAPEMLSGKPHDEHIDIWCIGCLMFELLTGRPPFEGPDKPTMFQSILAVRIKWPLNINKVAKDLISKILKANPRERLSLVDILEHQFFKQYIPNAMNGLVEPGAYNEEPFVISKDKPTMLKKTVQKKIIATRLCDIRDHSPLLTTSKLHLDQIHHLRLKHNGGRTAKNSNNSNNKDSNTNSTNKESNNEAMLTPSPISATNILQKNQNYTSRYNKTEVSNLSLMYKNLEKTYNDNQNKLNEVYNQINQLQATESMLRKELDDKYKKSITYQQSIEKLKQEIKEKSSIVAPLSRSKSFKKLASHTADKSIFKEANRKDSADTFELCNSQILTSSCIDRSSRDIERVKREIKTEEANYQNRINEMRNENLKLIDKLRQLSEKDSRNSKLISNYDNKIRQQETELAKHKKRVKELETQLSLMMIQQD